MDNKLHPATLGQPYPFQGLPYHGHPSYYPFPGQADPYFRGRGHQTYHGNGYSGFPGYGGYGGYSGYGELRDPHHYPPAYRYVSPERRKHYGYQAGVVQDGSVSPRHAKLGLQTSQS